MGIMELLWETCSMACILQLKAYAHSKRSPHHTYRAHAGARLSLIHLQ